MSPPMVSKRHAAKSTKTTAANDRQARQHQMSKKHNEVDAGRTPLFNVAGDPGNSSGISRAPGEPGKQLKPATTQRRD